MAVPVKIRRSNEVFILYSIKDHRKNPPRPIDPDGSVTLTVWAPGAIVVVNDLPMTRVSKGQYKLEWQSTPISLLGPYTGTVKIIHGGIQSLTFEEVLFDLEDVL